MAAANKHGLGRGLGALFGDEDLNLDMENLTMGTDKSGIIMVKTADLIPGKYQPRKDFNDEAIASLADSVKEKGILQPILVRRHADKYEIIAGERRFRAAKKAGLADVPVIIKEMSDNEVLEVALIENIVRQNLTALEEAAGLQQLMTTFSYTQEKLAKAVSKSRSYIANSLRLLQLPEDVKILLNEGKISAGHARTLVGLENAADLAHKIADEGLNVRQTEDLISALKQPEKTKTPNKRKINLKDTELQAIENNLAQKFGCKVQINNGVKGKGKVVLFYSDLSQLENILEILEK